MAELKQNENSRQSDLPHDFRKLFFAVEINKQHIQHNFLTCFAGLLPKSVRIFHRKLSR